jgi:hypothetical protein
MVRIALALALLAWTGIGVAVAGVLLVRASLHSTTARGNFSSFDFVGTPILQRRRRVELTGMRCGGAVHYAGGRSVEVLHEGCRRSSPSYAV